jgi:sterol desaturase/sphingolipid hydroxylase (fatty acid hydroxylase superfamily)
VHHHFPDHNYGVTMRFWDIVFGTVYRKPLPARAEAPTAAAPARRREPALIDV